MIRVTFEKILEHTDDGFVRYIEASGLSTDSKPTALVANGSLFLEVNTGDVYAFDEAGTAWDKICELGGGA